MNSLLLACSRPLVFAGLFSFFINLLVLVLPLYMLQVYDRVLSSRSIETLTLLTAIALFGLLSFALLDMLRQRLMLRAGFRLEERLAPPLLRQTVINALRRQDTDNGLRDIRQLRGFIASPTPLAFFDLPWTPAFLVLLFLFHPLLGAIAISGFVLLLALAVLDDLLNRKIVEATVSTGRSAADFADAAVRRAEVI